MRIFLKLLMAVVVLAVIAPFYLKDGQGVSLMSLNELKMPSLSMPKIPDSVQSVVTGVAATALPEAQTSETSQEKVKIHKWKDEDGTWHFSSADNSKKGTKSEVVLITLDKKNRYTPVVPPKQPQKEHVSGIDVENITPNPLLPLTHGKAAMDQAKQVKQLLEQRQQLQRQMMP